MEENVKNCAQNAENANFCIFCGASVPEGMMVCPLCEYKINKEEDFIEKNDKKCSNNSTCKIGATKGGKIKAFFRKLFFSK